MKSETFINTRKQRLSKAILENTVLNFNQVQKIIRSKDVKVGGVRVSKDIEIDSGEVVDIFYKTKQYKIIYEDDDILVAFKPRNIETVNEKANDFLSAIKEQIGNNIFAVHRLDRNTEGLVVFAKNERAKDDLDLAFKERTIQKYYLALVSGRLSKTQADLVAYLKKDEEHKKVFISDKKLAGYERIETKYKLVEKIGDLSLLEVELVTGKTHQIRAHLSHIGNPIVGDEKYGDSAVNKIYKKRYQCLSSYKIVFNFKDNSYLSRLNGLKLELDRNEIDF